MGGYVDAIQFVKTITDGPRPIFFTVFDPERQQESDYTYREYQMILDFEVKLETAFYSENSEGRLIS